MVCLAIHQTRMIQTTKPDDITEPNESGRLILKTRYVYVLLQKYFLGT